MPKKLTPREMAEANLRRVVKAVEGHFDDETDTAVFAHRQHVFFVGEDEIRAYHRGRYLGATCYSVYDRSWEDHEMPTAEHQASAVLALKHNPLLFTHWRKHPGKPRI